jgi:hypothetical protein
MKLVWVLIIVAVAAGVGFLYSFITRSTHPAKADLSFLEIVASPVSCEGYIDTANEANGILSVGGWLVMSKDGVVPGATFVSLTDQHGEKTYFETQTISRPDVKKSLNQPDMPDAGYHANIDVSSSAGNYTLGLARVYNGKLENCEQTIPIKIIGR